MRGRLTVVQQAVLLLQDRSWLMAAAPRLTDISLFS
jgi:hypothetical protein